MNRGTGENDPFDADARHEHMDREHHAYDGAERVGGVDEADGALTCAATHELTREQRQRHPRTEARRDHDERCDQLADDVESDIAARGAREAVQEPGHEIEREAVCRQGECGAGTHEHHDAGKVGRRIPDALDLSPHIESTQREAQDERAQHELERVGRAAEDQAQHPDPAELVHERGGAGEAGGECEPAGPRVMARAHHRRDRVRAPGSGSPRSSAQIKSDERHIENSRDADRARQPDGVNQHETADEHTDRCAQAVGEVQGRPESPRADPASGG